MFWEGADHWGRIPWQEERVERRMGVYRWRVGVREPPTPSSASPYSANGQKDVSHLQPCLVAEKIFLKDIKMK